MTATTGGDPATRLFIWNMPYHVSLGSAFAFAIASDVDAARAAIRAGGVSEYGHAPGRAVGDVALDIDRDPDRILDGPAGEIVEWTV